MQLTNLMQRMAEGDDDAKNELFDAIYDELHLKAEGYMRRQPRHHTLWVTDVVHGAYTKVCGGGAMHWNDRNHFFSVAARAMEHLLVDHARGKSRQKRTPPGRRQSLDDLQAAYEESIPSRTASVLDIHEALSELEVVTPRPAAVVRLRFFAQLSMDRVATTLGVPKRTVERDWAYARAWLKDWLGSHGRGT